MPTDSSEQPEELLASVGAETRPSSTPQCGVRLASPRPCPHSVHISISAPSPERAQSVAIIFMQIISQHPHTSSTTH